MIRERTYDIDVREFYLFNINRAGTLNRLAVSLVGCGKMVTTN